MNVITVETIVVTAVKAVAAMVLGLVVAVVKLVGVGIGWDAEDILGTEFVPACSFRLSECLWVVVVDNGKQNLCDA